MQPIIFIFHILSAVALVALILVQHGKGADIGAAFGSGASQTVFGSHGSTPFLIKVTALIAALFFTTSLTLGYLTAKEAKLARAATPALPTSPLTLPQSQPEPIAPPVAPTTITKQITLPVLPGTKPATQKIQKTARITKQVLPSKTKS
ncbi:MAG: preprotein translocase subunit SecG [Gammaproteobacteria bacterium]|jgi:preprotein translocase subunit SecG